jgi:hypothetical protein
MKKILRIAEGVKTRRIRGKEICELSVNGMAVHVEGEVDPGINFSFCIKTRFKKMLKSGFDYTDIVKCHGDFFLLLLIML